jgi:hypothetical protein
LERDGEKLFLIALIQAAYERNNLSCGCHITPILWSRDGSKLSSATIPRSQFRSTENKPVECPLPIHVESSTARNVAKASTVS